MFINDDTQENKNKQKEENAYSTLNVSFGGHTQALSHTHKHTCTNYKQIYMITIKQPSVSLYNK